MSYLNQTKARRWQAKNVHSIVVTLESSWTGFIYNMHFPTKQVQKKEKELNRMWVYVQIYSIQQRRRSQCEPLRRIHLRANNFCAYEKRSVTHVLKVQIGTAYKDDFHLHVLLVLFDSSNPSSPL